MDNHPAWQRMVDELAGDDEVARAELQEIGRWFPSVEMLANHARGLIDVMTDDEKRRALVDGPGTPPANILRFAMAETRSDDPRQRARWWMYRSATTPSPHPDPFRVASRAQSVRGVVLALPAPVNTAYWDSFRPNVLFELIDMESGLELTALRKKEAISYNSNSFHDSERTIVFGMKFQVSVYA